MSKLLSLLYFSYPIVVHLAIYHNHLLWALLWLACLLLFSAIRELTCLKKFTLTFLTYLVLATAVGLLAYRFPEILAKFIPLVIYTSMFSLFATSLMPGNIPLITRFASLMRGIKPDNLATVVQIYTRRVTEVWAGLFLSLGIVSLLLALYAPMYLWSLFTNVISYIIIGLLFLFEYAMRKRLVGGHMDYSFKEFAQRLAVVDFGSVFRSSK
ncbi:MAG: hypothetical protein IMF09_04960 [Proteobacteria bacterium]|nr:hypothetical protein [Pseudomonadota bacterium]